MSNVRKHLAEIKETAKRAIRVADAKVIDTGVTELDKQGFISMGGSLDSIIILAEELEKELGYDDNND